MYFETHYIHAYSKQIGSGETGVIHCEDTYLEIKSCENLRGHLLFLEVVLPQLPHNFPPPSQTLICTAPFIGH